MSRVKRLFWSWRLDDADPPPPKVWVKFEGSFRVVNHPLLSHSREQVPYVCTSFIWAVFKNPVAWWSIEFYRDYDNPLRMFLFTNRFFWMTEALKGSIFHAIALARSSPQLLQPLVWLRVWASGLRCLYQFWAKGSSGTELNSNMNHEEPRPT